MSENNPPLAELTAGIVIAAITAAAIVINTSELVAATGLVVLGLITVGRSYTRSKFK